MVIAYQLNKEQSGYYKEIIENIEQNHKDGAFDENHLMITGKAGVGKSFLTAQIVKYFQDNPISKYGIRVTTTTHKALAEIKKKLNQVNVDINALNGLSTVHSYFNIKPKINYKTGEEEFNIDTYAKQPKKCSILVIDEVSQMDEKLWNIVKSQRHLYETILLVGDEFQLQPVNTSEYNLFQDQNIKKFKLRNIVRQAKDNPIIQLASDIVEKIENKDFTDTSFCIKKAIEYSKTTNKIKIVQSKQERIKKLIR